MNEMAEYAMDKVGRRLGAIETARVADLRAIDVDASPEALEERFHVRTGCGPDPSSRADHRTSR